MQAANVRAGKPSPVSGLRSPLSEGPVVATLVLKAAGMQRQRIQVTKPRRNLDFHYRRGVGHVIEYTDLAKFQADEAALREIVRLPFNIRTVIGAVGVTDTARSSLVSFIADNGGHRPTKHAQLCEMRTLIDAEIVRLEKIGAGGDRKARTGTHFAEANNQTRSGNGVEAGASNRKEAPIPEPTAREKAINHRRAFLRRAGEAYVRGLVETANLPVKRLGNFQGMMDAIIAHEFANGKWPTYAGGFGEARKMENGKVPEPAAAEPAPEAGTAPAASNPQSKEPDLFKMEIDKLRALARDRGITAMNRNEIIAALTAPQ